MRAAITPEPALLGFMQNGPLHGYDLYKQVREHVGLIWRVEMSQMYAILSAYAARGWIGTQIKSQDTRPARKMLELTPAGRRAFEEWMLRPAHGLREFRVDFFLRLYFARVAGAPVAKKLITQQIASIKHELEVQRTREDAAGDDFFKLARDFRVHQLKTILKWLEDNRDELVRSKLTIPTLTEQKHHRAAPLRRAMK